MKAPAGGSRVGKGKRRVDSAAAGLRLAAVGLEAELELWLDGERVKPEQVFRSPRDLVRGELKARR